VAYIVPTADVHWFPGILVYVIMHTFEGRPTDLVCIKIVSFFQFKFTFSHVCMLLIM